MSSIKIRTKSTIKEFAPCKVKTKNLIKKHSFKYRMKELRNYSKYFLLAFIIIISYLSFVIVRPYLLAVLGAIILSYIFNPLYQGLLKKIRNRNVCALLMLFIVLLLILLPLFFTFQVLLQQLLTFSEGGRGEIIDKLTQQSLHPKIVEYIF